MEDHMSKETILKALMLSPVTLGVIGLILGLVFSRSYLEGFMWLGVCFGALVGTCAAVGCLFNSRFKCANISYLAVNLIIFVVVAKEMMIIA